MNNSELFEFLPFMVEDERDFSDMPLVRRVFLLVFYFTCGIWGSVMKLFLFYNLKQEKISERPINILIFIDQFVEYIGNMLMITNTTVKVTLSKLLFLNDLELSNAKLFLLVN